MKAFRSTLILLLIAVGVGGYIYLNERGPVVEPGSTVLARTDPAKITSLRLQQPNGEKFVLRKTGDAWSVQRGTAAPVPADPSVVAQVLAQLQLVQSSQPVSGEADKLREYGLDKPSAVLTAGATTIKFGRRLSFDPSKIYARVGTQAAVLPATLSEVVEQPFDQWRDKAVLRIAADDVKELQIEAPAIKARFQKIEATDDSDKMWKISGPVEATADLSAMNSFLYTLFMTSAAAAGDGAPTAPSGGITATKFLADNPKSLTAWGLDKPTAMLRVTTQQAAQSLLIGKKVSGGYAAKNSLSPTVFVISEMPFSLINRPLRAWRSKVVLDLDIESLTTLEIAARDAVRRFAKDNDKWHPAQGSTQATPDGLAPDAAAINAAVLESLVIARDLTAVDFIDKPGPLAAYGLDKPALSLAGLQIGTKNGKVYARAAEGSTHSTIYVLPADVLSRFKRPLDILFPPPQTKLKTTSKGS